MYDSVFASTLRTGKDQTACAVSLRIRQTTMKVPFSWLRDYVDISLTPAELAHKLTFAGLEVEALRYVGLPLPSGDLQAKISGLAWERDKIVLADIRAVNPHPNADRLVLLDLWDGEQQHVVLTGAPNLLHLRTAGTLPHPLKCAYIKLGAQVYDGHKAGWELTKLKRSKIRGIESYSMVASEKELGISEEHEGIILFDTDSAGNPPPAAGTPLVDYIGDVVLEVAITPNMVRNASILGIAREIAALLDLPLRTPKPSALVSHAAVDWANIQITAPRSNPRFTLTLLHNVQIQASPEWMQRRLRLAGMRAINNVVDVTNYVMLEQGYPLHAFDYDVLRQRAGGNTPTIITRFAQPGETLTTLDGQQRTLDSQTLLVCDSAGGLSVAGVMGGSESEVSQHTRTVLLEAAAWDYLTVRHSVQRYQLHSSQAGYRFSRGLHPAVAATANCRAVDLLDRLTGSQHNPELLDAYPLPAPQLTLTYPLREITRQLGMAIPSTDVVRILRALGFTVTEQGDTLRLEVPAHRLDIGTDVVGLADITEEIARIYGYDRIPSSQLADTMPPQRNNVEYLAEEKVRQALVYLGLQEVLTYRLTNPESEARLNTAPAYPYLALAKPITSDMTVMRQSLLNSVLQVAAQNLRHTAQIACFEIGPVFLRDDPNTPLPTEQGRVVVVLTGTRQQPFWQDQKNASLDFYDLKGLLDGLWQALHLPSVTIVTAVHPSLQAGRTASVQIGTQTIGVFGELHPTVRTAYGLPNQAVLVADLDLSRLLAALPARYAIQDTGRFPAVVEDIALIVPNELPAAQLHALIQQAGGKQLVQLQLFDVYNGDNLGAGKKSLAYRLTYQSPTGTLTDQDAAAIRTRIVKFLEKEVGAVLRAA